LSRFCSNLRTKTEAAAAAAAAAQTTTTCKILVEKSLLFDRRQSHDGAAEAVADMAFTK
jgi:hypothetical protein